MMISIGISPLQMLQLVIINKLRIASWQLEMKNIKMMKPTLNGLLEPTL
jgi:hypothetical protein